MRGKPRGGTFCHVFGFSSTLQRGDKRKGTIFWPFCTFWTRVAITAPRRPKRTKPGSNAAWVLGNQPVAGFARRFGRLARQHVRCGAHMCPFQGQKVPLGGKATRERSHVSQPIFARKRCFRSRPTGWRSKICQKTRCGEIVTKTAILGGFRRVGEIWVAAEEHFGSVAVSTSRLVVVVISGQWSVVSGVCACVRDVRVTRE